MAANRSGVTTVLFPDQNKKDLEDIPKLIRSAVKLVAVKHLSEVLQLALAPAVGRKPSAAWSSPRAKSGGREPGRGYTPPPQA